MTMWIIILWTVMALLGLALAYIGFHVPKFFAPEMVAHWSKIRYFLVGGWSVIGLMGLLTLCLDFVNAIVCALYLAMIWVVSDFIFGILQKFFHLSFSHYWAGYAAIILTVISLALGWYLNHHVWATHYTLKASKKVQPIRLVMFADTHLGTTFDGVGFQKHLLAMQAQNPDLVVVVGDYVDDNTTREEMIQATQALGQMKTKYGVFFVFGNHDKGYYGAAHRGFSGEDLVAELQKNNITVLRDEAVLLNDSFYVIGRQDASVEKEQKSHRKSMSRWTEELDQKKYMIVLDHQPTDYKNQAESGVDLVLSGHTHGGQLWPMNQVGKWIGANDMIYGHKKQNKTDFIVSSGISSWAIQFKTGTKSEFVVVDIK